MEPCRRIGRCSKPPQSRSRDSEPIVYRAAAQRADAHVPAPRFPVQQALYPQRDAKPWGSRAAVGSLLDILAITARGDVRGDVLKELERHLSAAQRCSRAEPGVDSARLRTVMSNLLRLRAELTSAGRELHADAARFRIPVRDQASQRHPRRHLRVRPAGLLLLAQPAEPTRARDLQRVDGDAPPAVRCRSSSCCGSRAQNGSRARRSRAAGMFHIIFERDTPDPAAAHRAAGGSRLYPEISGSHHRCSLRFLRWNGLHSRPVQTTEDVPFMLTCC